MIEASGPVNTDGYQQMAFNDEVHAESSEEQRDSILQPKENPTKTDVAKKKLSSIA